MMDPELNRRPFVPGASPDTVAADIFWEIFDSNRPSTAEAMQQYLAGREYIDDWDMHFDAGLDKLQADGLATISEGTIELTDYGREHGRKLKASIDEVFRP
jgi:hypothetical protein